MRKTKYDRPKIETEVLARVAAGESLSAVCRTDGFPAEATVRKWAVEEAEFGARYARAREARGERYGERVGEIAEAVLAGDHDPDRARVAIDALKWASARMASKSWGDKMRLEHAGPDGGPLVLQLSKAFAGAAAPVAAAPAPSAPPGTVTP